MTEDRLTRINKLLDHWKQTSHWAAEQNDAFTMASYEVDRNDEMWRRIVPDRFSAADVDDLEGPMLDAVTEWRQNPKRNLLALGDVGVGKTHGVIAAAKLAHYRNAEVRFWPVVELLDAMRPNATGDGEYVMGQACKCDMLILDDLGGEKPTDWAAERLYIIVNRRWLENRPILATSNLAAESGKGPLVDAIGARVYSRLVQDAVTVRVTGEDRRRAA